MRLLAGRGVSALARPWPSPTPPRRASDKAARSKRPARADFPRDMTTNLRICRFDAGGEPAFRQYSERGWAGDERSYDGEGRGGRGSPPARGRSRAAAQPWLRSHPMTTIKMKTTERPT